ncbi:hypothetical protein GCM10027413_13650 [Conyzicola nivalis]|uniref:Uncharacterized protein n=1 Tax=Conyzicola nivalis TaxID=1477021 RepID=A0A916SIZ2_9MICO|nr:hypothetical protein [Conyzicola nivalis]GGA99920.1 hypothetical protein GCM10010979_12980 [Conyzicola nivalis]
MTMQYDQRPLSIDIRLDALSPTEWRVCDKRVPESDHLSILGFIELRHGLYEVTTMDHPGERVIFDSLAAARGAFVPITRPRVHTAKLVV